MKKGQKISLVVPCFNEEKNVSLFYDACQKSFDKYDYKIEIVYVDDGSKDKTINELKKIVNNTKNIDVKVVEFSRNFGKESAMYAGLEHSTGDYVVIIDADLQQKPELIKDMVKVVEEDENIDIVCYYQSRRIENKLISFFKKSFYKFVTRVSDVEFYNGASDFRLFRRYVVDTILSLSEKNRFSKGLFSWIGFKTKYLPYVPEERATGKSNFNFKKLMQYAIGGIISFSDFPLRLSLCSGVFLSFVSFIYLIVCLIRFIMKLTVSKYYLLISIIIFSLGLILTSLGIVGEYIYKIHIESKNRPIYVKRRVLESDNK